MSGHGGYRSVYIPDDEDASVKEYIRMRDDHKADLTRLKQRIGAYCLHNGHSYDGTKWTLKHLRWLRTIELPSLLRETLDEYMASYDSLTARIDRLDARIEELADVAKYREKVKRLTCFLGINTLCVVIDRKDRRFHPVCQGQYLWFLSRPGTWRRFQW